MIKSAWTLLLLVVIGMLGEGCLVGGSSHVEREGSYISDSTLRTIQPGKTSSAWVLATMGEPTSKSAVDSNHEVWTYAYRETKDSSGYVFFLFGASDSKVVDGRVFVEIQDGIVTKTWRG